VQEVQIFVRILQDLTDTTTLLQHELYRCMPCLFEYQFTNIHQAVPSWSNPSQQLSTMQPLAHSFPAPVRWGVELGKKVKLMA